MMFLKDKGFVVKRRNFGESDRYITIFTQNHGKVDVLARGVRKITSRRAGSIELLNNITFQAVKTHSQFVLTEVQPENSPQISEKDLEHFKSFFLMCELIDALCPLSEKNSAVYELIKVTLHRFSKNKEVLSDFQKELLILLGYWDPKRHFYSDEDLTLYIEQILERNIKTNKYFKV